MTPKRREALVLFLDDGFDSPESHDGLVSAGYSVQKFRDHFKRDGRKREGVPDPSVIDLCAKNKWLLVTPDWNMEYTHTEEIARTDIGILATANNNDPIKVWVDAIRRATPKIERAFRKQPRPYFSKISRDGNLTRLVTIGGDRHSRRSRPQEKIEKLPLCSL